MDTGDGELGDELGGVDSGGNERVVVTEEDNKRIRRKTDKVILSILVWVYFLQILDKTILGYSAIFGLPEDTNLTGNQYSIIGSIAPVAQLAWQPFSSVLIVKVPHRILMPALVLGWGIAQTTTPLCHSFAGLAANRFFLGLFEAGCLPLFSVMTGQWYRRSEQPIRVAAWYGTNGLATIVAALLSYSLGSIQSPLLAPWQIIFLFTGLLTIATAPLIYANLSSSVATAHFLTPHERRQAVERLRANQTGVGTTTLQWAQVAETLADAKTYLWIAMALANNLGAQVTNTFGPLILSGLGFDKYATALLNTPFGALQYAAILVVAWAAARARSKAVPLLALLAPVLAGLVLLYRLPRGAVHTPGLLAGYYLLAFIFGGNTLIVSWILANTAGQTKKAAMLGLYNAAASAGNIVGPLLFDARDAPEYLPGLRATLAVFCAMVVVVVCQVANLRWLNWAQARRRVRNGKAAEIRDVSMEDEWVPGGGQGGLEDVTDRENDEFVYVY
ncbi:major facilitator superfamily domain-containing protein [Lasiosphaeris hirsuta]|uniref:Major facilitator superfamily domain-containing protein n=1 Tax=Lasiosphaeris hirsuta TaxID=260670 RepID=A0AA40ECE4_9PEZI|nr:major facilitator superfamily domain-containing protein [Lasiosphaeris hirsuta]